VGNGEEDGGNHHDFDKFTHVPDGAVEDIAHDDIDEGQTYHDEKSGYADDIRPAAEYADLV